MSLERWAKWGGMGLSISLLGVVGLWSASRLAGPTDAQEAALAAMRDLPPLEGRDAFPALWSIAYDIPEPERGRWLAEELRRARAGQMSAVASEDPAKADAGGAGRRYPSRLPTPDEFPLFCDSRSACLDRVAADRGRYAALIRRHTTLLDRVEALSAYGGIRHPRDERIVDTLLPPYQAGKLPATRHALDFVEGRREQAFDGTCRAISTWRRLGADSDTLISRLIGTAYAADIYGRLFADMLARTPRDFALPASCGEAFSAPRGPELSLCMAMQGELRFMRSAIRMGDAEASFLERLKMRIGISIEMTEAERAEQLVFHCGAKAEKAIASDRRIERARVEPDFHRFECVGNPIGCVLASIADGSFDGYAGRIQDGNAKLRLIAALLRLRESDVDASGFAAGLEAEAARVGDPMRAIGVDGDMLRMRLYANAVDPQWRIPLPVYFRSAVDAAGSP